MPLDQDRLATLFSLLWDLDDLKKAKLIGNPQDDDLEAAIKAAIDTEIAE